MQLSDPEYRKAWIRKRFDEVAGTFGTGYAETLEAALRMGDDGMLMQWLPGTWTDVGWIPPDGLPDEGHSLIGGVLSFYERARPWWWGDWIRHGERKHGQTYTQAIELSGRQYDTLAGYHWTVKRFEYDRRWLPPVYYSHHAAVAPKRFSAKVQDVWLAFVNKRELSVSDLGRLLRKFTRPADDPGPMFEWLDDWKAGETLKKKEREKARRVPQIELQTLVGSPVATQGGEAGAEQAAAGVETREVVCPHCGSIFSLELGEVFGEDTG